MEIIREAKYIGNDIFKGTKINSWMLDLKNDIRKFVLKQ